MSNNRLAVAIISNQPQLIRSLTLKLSPNSCCTFEWDLLDEALQLIRELESRSSKPSPSDELLINEIYSQLLANIKQADVVVIAKVADAADPLDLCALSLGYALGLQKKLISYNLHSYSHALFQVRQIITERQLQLQLSTMAQELGRTFNIDSIFSIQDF